MSLEPLHSAQAEAFQRREWLVERLGWIAIAGLLIAAVLGLLGSDGPLNRRSAEEGDLAVRYPPYLRHGAESTIEVRVARATAEGRCEVWVERGLLADCTIEQVIPEAQEMRQEQERTVFVFACAGPLRAEITISPSGYGGRAGRIGSGASAVDVRQFIYP